jgi:hypothetical protein
MSSPVTFTAESKRQLLRLLIETLERELQLLEEELLDVVTRPPIDLGYPHFDGTEGELRMACSNRTEILRELRKAGDTIPDEPRPVVEVYSVVQTRQAEQDTWYFIAPCGWHFERVLQYGEMRIHADGCKHFLVGTRPGHTYTSGGNWRDHSGGWIEEPLTHHVVGIF